ncbi:MAG: TonB family protein [Azonexus sp.]|nr:TonB family protein [Azonexus sp.]
MTRTDYRLFAALALSLTLHLLPFVPAVDFGQKKTPTVAFMVAELRPPPAAPTAPPLTLPEPPKPAATEAPKASAPEKPAKPRPEPSNPTKAPKTWTQTVRDHLKKLDAAGQFYPAEAIAQGLQGEVDVLLVIDEAGKVVAARVEQGSGHPILDEAALRAVRSLQSLPADAPRQVVLPVRFRLR